MKKLFFALSVILFVSGCMSTSQQEPTLVYINSGEIQCGSEGETVNETAQLLMDKNIPVRDSLCAQRLDITVIMMCGGPTTKINLHQISKTDLAIAQALGFKDVGVLKQSDNSGYELTSCK